MFMRLSAFALLVTGVPALAASSYGITLIPSPFGSIGIMMPQGLNDAGEVVGYVNAGGDAIAFYFIGGTVTTFGPDSSPSVASGVNASGKIAGYGGPFPTAFLFNPGVGYTQIGTLGGTSSEANGINALGNAVGTAATGGFFSHAFLYTGGPLIDLGTLGGHTSTAVSINNSGQIAGSAQTFSDGTHAFLYRGGALEDIGTLGGSESQAFAINDNGAVVGTSDVDGGSATHAFIYSDGVMKDLETLGGTNSYATSINESGDVVGYSDIPGNTATHAFLYRAGGMIDLNSLIDPASGWILETATAINNAGQITGMGAYGGGFPGFLLTPSIDTTPPSISLVNVVPGPPEQAVFSVVDPAGLLSISTAASNATVTVSAFNPGQTTPVTVTATKTDQSAGASVTISAEDVAGNQASFDPAFVTVYGTGGPAAAALSDVPSSEHVLTVTNGSPGLGRLRILVNQTTVVLPLNDGETRSLNLMGWMRLASNSIRFAGDGSANASASLVLRDATAKGRAGTRRPE